MIVLLPKSSKGDKRGNIISVCSVTTIGGKRNVSHNGESGDATNIVSKGIKIQINSLQKSHLFLDDL